jgi:hypothetical protein
VELALPLVMLFGFAGYLLGARALGLRGIPVLIVLWGSAVYFLLIRVGTLIILISLGLPYSHVLNTALYRWGTLVTYGVGVLGWGVYALSFTDAFGLKDRNKNY